MSVNNANTKNANTNTNTNNSDELVNFLKTKIKDSKKSLRTIASLAGFKSPSGLSMVLSGTRKLSLESAIRISKALGLDSIEHNKLLKCLRLKIAPF